MVTLGLQNLKPTPTILELANRSTIRPIRKLEDITISVDSWQYLIDILVLHTKSLEGGHSLILGRPWLATAYAYSGCWSGNMVISNGEVTKNLILYPSAEPIKVRFNLVQKSLPKKGLNLKMKKLDQFLPLVMPSVLRMKWRMIPLVPLSVFPTPFLIQTTSY